MPLNKFHSHNRATELACIFPHHTLKTIALIHLKGTLITKSITATPSSSHNDATALSVSGELPVDATLTFLVRAQSPATFLRDAQIEVGDGGYIEHCGLSVSNGAMTLQNSSVAVVSLSPASALDLSGFGPLQFRLVLRGVTVISSRWQHWFVCPS